ncbi:MAG TPA: PA14 domain-containing protein [Burkholderiaceae bacterium]|nr:PA14 domain-containing protein [Burkholderiaceae bacterium]
MTTLTDKKQIARLVLAGLAACASAAHADVVLAPELAGLYQAGSGVDGHFLKINDAWHDSSVLWNEETQSFGSGVAIGSLEWGTGIWGLADWHTAYSSPTPGMIEASWTGRASPISYGDADYNTLYGATWGEVGLAPLFAPNGPSAGQDNWTSHFAGYVRITEAGTYNFSVLHDDGFFLRLGGADSTLSIENDFLNPRERLGFESNLQLGVGLYSFELGAYDRLQSGVVELSWSRDGGDWSVVPIENLLMPGDVAPVPEPSSWAMMVAGLLGVGAFAARRRRGARGNAG